MLIILEDFIEQCLEYNWHVITTFLMTKKIIADIDNHRESNDWQLLYAINNRCVIKCRRT